MDQTFQARLAELGDEVRSAAIPGDCQHTTLWCLGRLPALYAKFRQTNETRYGDEITRLVEGVLKDLVKHKKACPEAPALAGRINDRLRQLHEEFGLPGLEFKTPSAPSSRSRKAG
jgi:hypothetical protein